MLSLAIHLEALCKGMSFSFDHSLSCEDHVVLDLVLEDIDLTSGLVVLLENVFVLLIDLFG